MARGKPFHTNFTAGELSDLIGARPDIQKYFNGCSILENFHVYPEGGAFRRYGTRYNGEVKFSQKQTRLIPFEFNVSQTYAIEVGDQYARIYGNDNGALRDEIVTPWQEAHLRAIHFRQSADILFLTNPNFQQQQINRIADTDWTITPFNVNPPPSFEPDIDISLGATLTPSAVGIGIVTFTASGGVFLQGDVGREIISGTSKATIQTFNSTTEVVGRVSRTFQSTNPIPSGQWFLRGSPFVALDPNIKEPVGAYVTLTTTTPAFRAADVGRFIRIWDGVVELVVFTSNQEVSGFILEPLSGWTSSANPDAAPAGAWTLEDQSWSDTYGWPRTLEFHQGRLYFAGTNEQPTTFWGSQPNKFDNFARGSLADQAVEYTIAARRVNVIAWLNSLGQLFIGDAQNEHVAKGQGVDAPLGGDVVPFVKDQSSIGSLPTQPTVCYNSILFVNRSANKIYELSYALEEDSFTPKDRTLLSRQIGEHEFFEHPAAYAQEPNSIIYFVSVDGELLALTFNKAQEVSAWSRFVTDGGVESVIALPDIANGMHKVWLIVQRNVNGVTKRYREIIDSTLQTDCATTGTILNGANQITGLTYLEGKTVDVLLDGSYIGQKVVTSGVITLDAAVTQDTAYEVGLHYRATLRTMRAAIPQGMTEGYRRHFNVILARLRNSIGGEANGQPLVKLEGGARPYTGLAKVHPTEADFDGYITVIQDQPYPFEILGIMGEVEFNEQPG